MTISPRFVVPICLLLGFALVPTIIHSYLDKVERDALRTSGIENELAGYRGTATKRGASWGQRRFGSDDWIERAYVNGRDEVHLTVVRSPDPKALYHHPELAIADAVPFAGTSIVRFPQRSEIPVFVLEQGIGSSASALYALHYDDEFVEAPISFQLRTAGQLLFSPRKLMTLFFVLDRRPAANRDLEGGAAAEVLLAAIESFLGQTSAPGGVLSGWGPESAVLKARDGKTLAAGKS